MKISVFILSLMIGAFGAPVAFAVDFEGHTQFTNIDLEGEFWVRCSGEGRVKRAYHQCRGYILNPIGAWARFSDDSGIQADRVELQTTRKDTGRVITKRMKWDSRAGETSRAVNLWTWTLFQRPLLEMGDNEVRYAYTKNGQRVGEGSVFVNVRDGGVRSCETQSYSTVNMSMCNNMAYACDFYFNRQNNCE